MFVADNRHDEPPILEADFFRNPHLHRVTKLRGNDGCGCSARPRFWPN